MSSKLSKVDSGWIGRGFVRSSLNGKQFDSEIPRAVLVVGSPALMTASLGNIGCFMGGSAANCPIEFEVLAGKGSSP